MSALPIETPAPVCAYCAVGDHHLCRPDRDPCSCADSGHDGSRAIRPVTNDGPAHERRTVEQCGGLSSAGLRVPMTITAPTDTTPVDPNCRMRDVDETHVCRQDHDTLQPGEACWATSPTPARIVVRSWDDGLIALDGNDPLGHYVEMFWLPVIGPTATWMLRRFGGLLKTSTVISIDSDELGASMGIGGGNGRHSVVAKTLRRLVVFGLAVQSADGSYQVRTLIPRLDTHQLRRLPQSLQMAHARWERAQVVKADF